MNTNQQRLLFEKDKPWLAPLAGYSDLPFRLLAKKHGAHVVCTEMVSVKGLFHQNRGTQKLLATHKDDTPLVLQLFGPDAPLFEQAIPLLKERGFSFFDLNAGCSVRKVLKSGSGAALLWDVPRLISIAKSMVKSAGEHAVGIKIRLGPDESQENYLDVAKKLEDVGVAWITLHPRYAKELFSGHARWECIAKLKEHVNLPVIASGDLFTAEDGVRCITETNADTLMFARGALYNPTIFAQYNKLLNNEPIHTFTPTELSKLLIEHITLYKHFDDSPAALRRIRSFAPRYAKGFNKIKILRSQMASCETWEELLTLAHAVASLDIFIESD